ncbi:CU044_5270 family protein [Actinomadura rupiterrae]|uniref:CU044_5270 family protein n=1 Tax=Actinomadura rupiterrae TaxID=559627 RepID=UPI0020A28215|nr:CU044_5270 family protein [Actinomadura rupiterrae]MCP2341464.1 hypothetical protein [Actinomadura rupiterrae]
MDDDLLAIADTLAKDDPSSDVVDRRRHQLQNAMRGGGTTASHGRRRILWALGGTGLTGVAAAGVAVALLAGSSGTATTHGTGPRAGASPAATAMSTRQVFLVAAESAAREPERIGKYWHLAMLEKDAQGKIVPDQSYDRWFLHDGRHYSSGAKTDYKPWLDRFGERGFRIGGPVLSFEEVRALPSDPDALVKRLTTLVKDAHIRTSAGELNAKDRRIQVLDDLFVLSTQAPVTAKVRAAAFRALAAASEVKSLGPVRGGQGLRLPMPGPDGGTQDVVLDPTTGRMINSSEYVDYQGGFMTMEKGHYMTIVAEWTDTLPKNSRRG